MPRHPTLGWCLQIGVGRATRAGRGLASWVADVRPLTHRHLSVLRFLFGDAGLPHLQPVRINEAALFLVGTLPGSAGSQFSQSVAIAFGSS